MTDLTNSTFLYKEKQIARHLSSLKYPEKKVNSDSVVLLWISYIIPNILILWPLRQRSLCAALVPHVWHRHGDAECLPEE